MGNFCHDDMFCIQGSERYYMKALEGMVGSNQGAKKILFAGYNDETLLAVKLAQDMAPRGSEVTILAETIPADELGELRSTPNCKLRVVKGVPSSHAVSYTHLTLPTKA